MPRWLRHGALVVLFYGAVTAVFTYSLVFRLSTAVLRGGAGDYQMETSIVAWNAHQILRDPLGLHDLPFYYPCSRTVAYQQPEYFTGLLAAPSLLLGAPPLFVINLFAVVALVTSGALTYLLAYSITGRVGASLVAGMVYAFFTNRLDHLGQFTYQMAACPRSSSGHSRASPRRRWRDVALLVAALSQLNAVGDLSDLRPRIRPDGFTAAYLLLRPAALTRRLALRGTAGLLLFRRGRRASRSATSSCIRTSFASPNGSGRPRFPASGCSARSAGTTSTSSRRCRTRASTCTGTSSSGFVRAHPTAEFALRFDGDDPDVTRWIDLTLNGRRSVGSTPAAPRRSPSRRRTGRRTATRCTSCIATAYGQR